MNQSLGGEFREVDVLFGIGLKQTHEPRLGVGSSDRPTSIRGLAHQHRLRLEEGL